MVAGTRGRIAQSDEEKRARGNPGHRKLAPVSTLPVSSEDPVDVPSPPKWLTNKQALAFWKEDAPICAAMGSLAQPDCYLFAILCKAKAEYLRIEKLAEKKPSYVKTKKDGKYDVKCAEVVKLKELLAQIVMLSDKFGLTAGARKRNHWKLPVKVNSERQSDLSSLLNGHRNR